MAKSVGVTGVLSIFVTTFVTTETTVSRGFVTKNVTTVVTTKK